MLRYAAITVVLTVAVIGGTRQVFAGILRPSYTRDKVLAGMQLMHRPADAVVYRTPPPVPPPDTRPVLESIRERGVLRVGYMSDSLPFAFFNAKGELVGFDVELAHHLARELGVTLEFLPVDRATLDAVVCRPATATSS